MSSREVWDHLRGKCVQIMDMHDAVIGYTMRNGQLIIVYDFSKMVKILIKQQRMTFDEAVQYVEEEVEPMWVGEATPAIVRNATYDEIRKMFIDSKESLN